jgi:hypothetical protein
LYELLTLIWTCMRKFWILARRDICKHLSMYLSSRNFVQNIIQKKMVSSSLLHRLTQEDSNKLYFIFFWCSYDLLQILKNLYNFLEFFIGKTGEQCTGWNSPEVAAHGALRLVPRGSQQGRMGLGLASPGRRQGGLVGPATRRGTGMRGSAVTTATAITAVRPVVVQRCR